ncbi:unnamed protein product [Durusdinium trenchii]|uniref:Uncharacterized protein n=1 Tax=Durusdinium trenchii TaxID=1381693 RepID=A0ABP0Q0E9_9DINO
MAMLRYPLDPISEGLLKELVLKDLDENTFLLKVILDGKKLDSVGYGKGDGTDRVRYWKKVTVNPAAMSISVVDYVNDGEMGAWITDAKEEVVSTCSVNFLEDPVQIEFCLDKDGERLASPEHRDGMYPWTDAIVANIMSFKNAKVKVRPDAPSIKEKGLKSLVSEPMDEHVSYESFFAQLVTSSREALSSVPGNVMEESAGEMRFTNTSEGGEVSTNVVKFNESTGEFVVTFSSQGKVRSELHRVVHRSPLVMEGWDIDADGNRLSGMAKAKEVQKNINNMIDKANSWF